MKRLFPILAAGIMASLSIMAGIGTVHAQEKAEARFYGAVTPRHISMGVGKSEIIDLPQDAAEIFVADPMVANAVVRSPRKLYVIGVAAGQTSVFALDHQGRKIAALELSIGRGDPGDLQQILRAAMPAAAITARTINDTIILTGTVDSIEDAQRATDIANGFVQRLYGAGPSGGRQRMTTPAATWVRPLLLAILLVGLIESFTTQYLGPGMIDIVVFALLLMMLAIRPTGMIAEKREENV